MKRSEITVKSVSAPNLFPFILFSEILTVTAHSSCVKSILTNLLANMSDVIVVEQLIETKPRKVSMKYLIWLVFWNLCKHS